MYRTVQNLSDANDLQADTNLFVLRNNNLKLNIKNVNHFYCPTGLYQNVNIAFMINGKSLERVQSYKYLGVTSLLIYLGVTILLKYVQELRDKWVCFTVAFIMAAYLSHSSYSTFVL